MADMQVRPVQSRRDQKDFLQLPWSIYAGDPYWVPPLRGHQKEMVGFTHHPFYLQAQSQCFVAYRNGRACGRIAAIINHAHNARYHERIGFWGFFESIDDTEVARALFAAARSWLAEHEIQSLRGPCNPSLNYEIGLLIDGFDSSPVFMMTYNKPYYARLVESCGFGKCQDLFAFYGHVDMLEELDQKLTFVVNEATRRFNITTRMLDRSRFDAEVRMFLDIYNRSLVDTWGFVPLSDAEVDHMAASLKMLIVPEMTSVAEIDGRPIGAMFGLLDYNPRIRQINGRLFPLGFIRLLRNRKGIKRVRLISTNVIPEYQRWGVGLVLVSKILPEVIQWGITEAEFSWVLESNHLSRSTLQRGGAKLYKTYRIYEG
jgi:GNAT superfamily N-acetyltransferase